MVALARVANAGGPYTPVVVSPLIGDTLDVRERRTYDLLPGVADFRWAVFFRERDYTVSALVATERNGSSRERMVELRCTIAGLRQKIEQHQVVRVEPRPRMQGLIPPREKRGERLVIQTLYGERVEAELLAVWDDSLIVGSDEFIPGSRALEGIGYVRLIPSEELGSVVIEGSSYRTAGAVAGAVLGAVVGAIAAGGYQHGGGGSGTSVLRNLCVPFFSAMAMYGGAVLGAGVGGVFGYGVGSLLSTKDVVVHPRHIWSLHPMARFQGGEPDEICLMRAVLSPPKERVPGRVTVRKRAPGRSI
jgi:hypothetical protein